MRRKLLTILVVVNVVGTLGAVAWGLLWLQFGELALYDTNLEAFQSALTPEQGRGITLMAQSLLRGAVVPLVLTNFVWLLVLVARSFAADECHDATDD